MQERGSLCELQSAMQSPDFIFGRSGKTYRAFAKFQFKMCAFIQERLKELMGQ
jgi:hypothetical protein